MKSNPATEKAILLAATQIFRREGLAGARMQAIADAANINKALLHYYFDSKEVLFEAVRQEAVRELRNALAFLETESTATLPQLLTRAATQLYSLAQADTDLFLFLCTELRRHPSTLSSGIDLHRSALQQRLSEAASTGLVRPTSAHTALTLLFALTVLPTFAHELVGAIADQSQVAATPVVRWPPDLVATQIIRMLQA